MRRPIDPKIIDDSSEDEAPSSNENNNDNDDDDDDDEELLPLGPALPPPNVLAAAQSPTAPVPTANEPASSPPVHYNVDALPIADEVRLGSEHDSYVSCLSLEASGNRLVSASLDGTAKLWDFNAMDRTLQSFRTLSPFQDCAVRVASFSPSGAHLLFCGADPTAVVTDRDGSPVASTVRGDMYIVDTTHTKGHTAPINAALWNSPSGAIVTASADATVRIWDIQSALSSSDRNQHSRSYRPGFNKRSQTLNQLSLFKLRSLRGGKTPALAADWAPAHVGTSSSSPADKNCSPTTSGVIAVACGDGVTRLVDPRARDGCALGSCKVSGSHDATCIISSRSSSANSILAVRAGDELHVMDTRQFTKPMRTFNGLPNAISETGVTFIEDNDAGGLFIVTGTSVRKDKDAAGDLCVFGLHQSGVEPLRRLQAPSGCGSVVAVLFHDSTNQVLYGTADGTVHVRYDETLSRRGVLQCLPKSHARRKHGMASVGVGPVLSGNALFMAGRGRGGCGSLRERLHSALVGEDIEADIMSDAKKKRLKRNNYAESPNEKLHQVVPPRPPASSSVHVQPVREPPVQARAKKTQARQPWRSSSISSTSQMNGAGTLGRHYSSMPRSLTRTPCSQRRMRKHSPSECWPQRPLSRRRKKAVRLSSKETG